MPVDPDRPCPHEDFSAQVCVNRLVPDEDNPVEAYSADISVVCAQCDEPFQWIGLGVGVDYGRPMVSVDGREMRAPLRPESADPDFGLGFPGYAVRVVESGKEATQ